MLVLAIANPITFLRRLQNQPWGIPWTAAPSTFRNFERKTDFGRTLMDACSGCRKSYHFSPRGAESVKPSIGGTTNLLIFVFVLLGALQALFLLVGSSRPLVGSGSNLQPEIAPGGVRTPADDQISAIGCRPTPYPRCCSGRRDIYQPMALGIFERMYHTFFGRRKPCSKRVFFSESVEF